MSKIEDRHLRVLEKEKVECMDFVDLLGDYYDKDLPSSLRVRLSIHKQECNVCNNFHQGYEKVIDLAKEIKDEPAPIEVRRRLRMALNQKLGIDLPMP